MTEKKRLLGMTLDELKAVAAEVSLPNYAAKQMADWLYKKKVTAIADMTNYCRYDQYCLGEAEFAGRTL